VGEQIERTDRSGEETVEYQDLSEKHDFSWDRLTGSGSRSPRTASQAFPNATERGAGPAETDANGDR